MNIEAIAAEAHLNILKVLAINMHRLPGGELPSTTLPRKIIAMGDVAVICMDMETAVGYSLHQFAEDGEWHVCKPKQRADFWKDERLRGCEVTAYELNLHTGKYAMSSIYARERR